MQQTELSSLFCIKKTVLDSETHFNYYNAEFNILHNLSKRIRLHISFNLNTSLCRRSNFGSILKVILTSSIVLVYVEIEILFNIRLFVELSW